MLEGSLLAVLALNGPQPFRFERDDQDLLNSFVAQAAVALRNAQLYAETQRREREATILYESTRNVGTAVTLDQILNKYSEIPVKACARHGAGTISPK